MFLSPQILKAKNKNFALKMINFELLKS